MGKRMTRSQKSQIRKKKSNPMVGNYIIPTEHAVKRYQERIKMMNPGKAQNAIVEGVRHSRLIALTRYGGREIRENKGIVFVCELHGNELYVITVLVSQVDLRFVV